MNLAIDREHSHPEAVKKYDACEQPVATTDITGDIAYGYGNLNDNGFWEFPLLFVNDAVKVEYYESVLKDIAEFGHKNPGCGFSCSCKADTALNRFK